MSARRYLHDRWYHDFMDAVGVGVVVAFPSKLVILKWAGYYLNIPVQKNAYQCIESMDARVIDLLIRLVMPRG